MAQQIDTNRSGDPGTFLTGYRWIATVFALLMIIQAFLGMRGFLGKPNMVDIHEMLANAMFLLAAGQAVLAWLLYSRNIAVAMPGLVLNGVLVLLTIAQIGLGYSAIANDRENFPNLISLHVPNGVLLTVVSTSLAVMAWQVGGRRSAA